MLLCDSNSRESRNMAAASCLQTSKHTSPRGLCIKLQMPAPPHDLSPRRPHASELHGRDAGVQLRLPCCQPREHGPTHTSASSFHSAWQMVVMLPESRSNGWYRQCRMQDVHGLEQRKCPGLLPWEVQPMPKSPRISYQQCIFSAAFLLNFVNTIMHTMYKTFLHFSLHT